MRRTSRRPARSCADCARQVRRHRPSAGLAHRLGRHAPVRACGRTSGSSPRARYRELVDGAALRGPPGADLRHARARRRRRPRQGHPRGQRHARAPARSCWRCRPTRPSGAPTRPGCSRPARRSSAPSRASASRPTTATGTTTSSEIGFMVESGVMEDYTWLWYDVRPHPKFGTVEVRVCDSQTRVEHTLALAALVQAMVKELCEHYEAGGEAGRLPVADARREQVAGGPPRARRRAGRPALQRARRQPRARRGALYDRLREHAQDLGSAAELEGIEDLLTRGNGATASSSSTRPTTTCARSWPRSSRRRRLTALRPERSAARAGGARRARSRPASAGSRRRWRRS